MSGNPNTLEAISDDQWQSVAISGNPRTLEAQHRHAVGIALPEALHLLLQLLERAHAAHLSRLRRLLRYTQLCTKQRTPEPHPPQRQAQPACGLEDEAGNALLVRTLAQPRARDAGEPARSLMQPECDKVFSDPKLL